MLSFINSTNSALYLYRFSNSRILFYTKEHNPSLNFYKDRFQIGRIYEQLSYRLCTELLPSKYLKGRDQLLASFIEQR